MDVLYSAQRAKTKITSRSTTTMTTSYVALETAGETGEEHSDRSKANEEADRIIGDGHHARCFHPVVEAGSIVSQASNNMSEGKKMVKTVKKQARQQQQKRLKRFQKKTWKSEDSSRRGEVHPKKRNKD